MNQMELNLTSRCPNFEGCSAPLCHIDKSLSQAVWYPGEPVCKLRQCPKWVKMQRRIAKVLGIPKDADNGQEAYGAFSVQMLESAKRITPKIRGIDFESETEGAWHNKRQSLSAKGGITDMAKTLDTSGTMLEASERQTALI